MKTIADLQVIRDRLKQDIAMRGSQDDRIHVVVGMATCGISAGARPVLAAFVDEVDKEKIENVTITQTGCGGICQYEPVVEVYQPDGEKTTYVKMTVEKAIRVVHSHLKKGQVVSEYTMGNK